MDSGKILEKAGASVEYAEQYIEQYKDLLVLELTERLAVGSSILISRAIVLAMVLMSLLLFFIGVGWALTDLWGSPLAGFGVAACCLLLLTGSILIFQKKLITDPTIQAIIKATYNEED